MHLSLCAKDEAGEGKGSSRMAKAPTLLTDEIVPQSALISAGLEPRCRRVLLMLQLQLDWAAIFLTVRRALIFANNRPEKELCYGKVHHWRLQLRCGSVRVFH